MRGTRISALSEANGHFPTLSDGLRVTDAATMEIVEDGSGAKQPREIVALLNRRALKRRTLRKDAKPHCPRLKMESDKAIWGMSVRWYRS
jgi:acetylglutamate kinase